jgi:hypothetical protein
MRVRALGLLIAAALAGAALAGCVVIPSDAAGTTSPPPIKCGTVVPGAPEAAQALADFATVNCDRVIGGPNGLEVTALNDELTRVPGREAWLRNCRVERDGDSTWQPAHGVTLCWPRLPGKASLFAGVTPSPVRPFGWRDGAKPAFFATRVGTTDWIFVIERRSLIKRSADPGGSPIPQAWRPSATGWKPAGVPTTDRDGLDGGQVASVAVQFDTFVQAYRHDAPLALQ